MNANCSIEPLEGRQLLAAGTLGFAFSLGGTGEESVTAQVTDSAGNLYLAGWLGTNSTVDFNPSASKTYNLATGFGGPEQYLAKYTAGGALVWARRAGGHYRISTLGIDRATGNLLAGGEYYGGTATFASGITLTAPIDASYGYWGRISPKSGAFTFVKQALTGVNCYVTQVDSDAAGNIYVAGARGGDIYLDQNETSYPTTAAVMEKFSPNGRYIWGRSYKPRAASGVADLTQDYFDAFDQMAVSPNGQIYAAGVNKTDHPSDLGLTAKGWYLVSFEAGGGKMWGDTVTGLASGEAIKDLAVDGAGNVLVVGAFTGTTDFNIDPNGSAVTLVASGGHTDGFVAKYDVIGRLQYTRQIGLDGDLTQGDVATSVAVDGEGYVYVGGSTWGTTYFGTSGFRFRSGDNRDAFISKYKARGTFLTAWLLGGGPASDEISFLSAGPGNAIFASGQLHGLFDANPGSGRYNLMPVADPDVFVVKVV